MHTHAHKHTAKPRHLAVGERAAGAAHCSQIGVVQELGGGGGAQRRSVLPAQHRHARLVGHVAGLSAREREEMEGGSGEGGGRRGWERSVGMVEKPEGAQLGAWQVRLGGRGAELRCVATGRMRTSGVATQTGLAPCLCSASLAWYDLVWARIYKSPARTLWQGGHMSTMSWLRWLFMAVGKYCR